MSKPTLDVALALVQRNGHWLVAQRHPDAHLGGLWEFPGGKLLPGETPTQGALRELQEECGVAARPLRVLAAVRCEYPDRVVHLTPVVCEWLAGEPRPLASRACQWVTPAQLGALDMPAINARIIAAAQST